MSYKELGAKGLFLIQNEPGRAVGRGLIPERDGNIQRRVIRTVNLLRSGVATILPSKSLLRCLPAATTAASSSALRCRGMVSESKIAIGMTHDFRTSPYVPMRTPAVAATDKRAAGAGTGRRALCYAKRRSAPSSTACAISGGESRLNFRERRFTRLIRQIPSFAVRDFAVLWPAPPAEMRSGHAGTSRYAKGPGDEGPQRIRAIMAIRSDGTVPERVKIAVVASQRYCAIALNSVSFS